MDDMFQSYISLSCCVARMWPCEPRLCCETCSAVHVWQLLVVHLALSRGLESVNRSLSRRPGLLTILIGGPLCITASLYNCGLWFQWDLGAMISPHYRCVIFCCIVAVSYFEKSVFLLYCRCIVFLRNQYYLETQWYFKAPYPAGIQVMPSYWG